MRYDFLPTCGKWHEVRDVRYLQDVNFGNPGAFGADHDVIGVGQGLVEFGSECWDDVACVCTRITLCMFAGGLCIGVANEQNGMEVDFLDTFLLSSVGSQRKVQGLYSCCMHACTNFEACACQYARTGRQADR